MSLAELALRSFTTFFATIGPVDVAVIFAVLTTAATPKERRILAIRGVVIGSLILTMFMILGDALLKWLGISPPALRTAGGVLLMLLAIDMVFGRVSAMSSTTSAETSEAKARQDISVFPLATPLIAGPAAMGGVVLMKAEAQGDFVSELVVYGTLIGVLVLTLVLLLVATQVQKVLGVTGQHVVSRLFGVLLAALAVQFVFDGLAASGLFDPAPRM